MPTIWVKENVAYFSFCYFVAKIQDELQDEINRNKLIIYIDDPMSSLDSKYVSLCLA